MRAVRVVVTAAAFVWALGCAGAGEKLFELSGGEMEFATGADAVVPEDFPMPAPEGGTLEASGRIGIAGTLTTTVQYVIPAESAVSVIDGYQQLMEHAGLKVTRTTGSGGEAVVGDSDTAAWTAGVTKDGDRTLLSLIVVQKPGE